MTPHVLGGNGDKFNVHLPWVIIDLIVRWQQLFHTSRLKFTAHASSTFGQMKSVHGVITDCDVATELLFPSMNEDSDSKYRQWNHLNEHAHLIRVDWVFQRNFFSDSVSLLHYDHQWGRGLCFFSSSLAEHVLRKMSWFSWWLISYSCLWIFVVRFPFSFLWIYTCVFSISLVYSQLASCLWTYINLFTVPTLICSSWDIKLLG